MVIDGNTYHISKGTTVFIPRNAEHGIENSSHEPLKSMFLRMLYKIFGDLTRNQADKIRALIFSWSGVYH